MSSIVIKPWGQEIVLTSTDLPYTGKIITIIQGKRWSLQYHDQKTETFCCISGQAKLITGSSPQNLKEEEMIINEGYTIKPGTIHRVQAITDVTIIEVSSPESGTTFRLEDDSNRPNETPEIRNSPNRGWDQPPHENQSPNSNPVV